MELIVVVVISAGIAENSLNGVIRSLNVVMANKQVIFIPLTLHLLLLNWDQQ